MSEAIKPVDQVDTSPELVTNEDLKEQLDDLGKRIRKMENLLDQLYKRIELVFATTE